MMRTALWVSVGLSLVACSNESGLVTDDDFEDPTLSLDSPAAAEWMSQGFTEVKGNAAGLTDLTVNGVAVELDRDKFSGQVELVRGVNIVEAVGVDSRGAEHFVRHGVLAGPFADPGQAIEDAAFIRLNQGGIDDVLDLVADMIVAEEINATVQGANPVYSDSYGVWGWDAVTVRADVAEVWFAPVRIDADPQSSALALDVAIPDLFLAVDVSGDVVGWDFDVQIWVWATRAELSGYATVGANNGQLHADFVDSGINLVGFGYDTSLLPGDIESYILVDTIRGFLEDMLEEKIDEMVPALLEEQLANLDLSFETELLDRQVAIEGTFASASIDQDGIQLGVDLDVNIPGAGTHTYAGYLSSDADLPRIDHSSDMALSLSDDLLNRVLFEAWRSGLLVLELSTADGSLDPMLLSALHAHEGTITVDAVLPPVIVEHNRGLQVQISELEITIATPGGEMGEYITLSVTVVLDAAIKVTGGTMRLDFGTPEVSLVVRDSDWGASNEATTALVEDMLPLDTFLALLGDIEFKLPELAGIAIERADVERDLSGFATGVEVTLR